MFVEVPSDVTHHTLRPAALAFVNAVLMRDDWVTAEALSVKKYPMVCFQWLRNPTNKNTSASEAMTSGAFQTMTIIYKTTVFIVGGLP